ncbi:MAG: U32 family peptidase [Clostridiales bacterium]|nr:U32 family peptidase [Clostridiales bacterium]
MILRPELLAPAGNIDCLKAAVLSGADAVYFGGGAFNARRGAKNFVGEELDEAVEYCRLRKVRTNITLNTLLFDRELPEALSFAAHLYNIGADAVIVQDLGLAALIRRELPHLPVHASTQMGIHTPGGLKLLEKMGISRAVLAREVPLDEIRRMHEESPVELEFFCHGALCMSFSGSCLYSSMAGERSGNRGTCAQPCRKNASVLKPKAGRDEFALSTNDICMIRELPALIDAGVCSFKIEGRMKSPEYVATVTRIYRRALDGERDPAAKKKLFSIFNRGEFSTSHLRGDSVTTGHVGSAKPDKELIAEAHEAVRKELPKWELSAKLRLVPGEEAELLFETEGFSGKAEGVAAEEAITPPDKARLYSLVNKLGDTPFTVKELELIGDGFVPVSALNAMRRSSAEELERNILRLDRAEAAIDPGCVSSYVSPAGGAADAPKRYVRVRTEAEAVSLGAELVGFDPVNAEKADLNALKGVRGKLILILPNVLMTEGAREAYKKLLASGVFSGVEANNIGQWDMGRELPIRIAGVGMNAFNGAAFTFLFSLGFTHIMPSLELTARELGGLSKDFGSVMIVNTFGRAPLMQLMHCPVKEYRGCRGCSGSAGVLADGEGRRFPLENVRFPGGYCLVRLLNSAVTDIRDAFAGSGIGAFAVAETPDRGENKEVTRGHFKRQVL